MAQAKTILPITDEFIEAYTRLKNEGKMPKHKELCIIMGINKVSTLSEILGRRQNIQPEQWQKFKDHFLTNKKSETTENNLREPATPYITQSQRTESTSENNLPPEVVSLLNKYGETLERISKSLDTLNDTQKLILEKLKTGKQDGA